MFRLEMFFSKKADQNWTRIYDFGLTEKQYADADLGYHFYSFLCAVLSRFSKIGKV